MQINNTFYHELGERWYTAKDDPIALLRAEAKCRNPWVLETLSKHFPDGRAKILDIACGAGFLSNALAAAGHQVDAIDLSQESLAVARRWDNSGSVRYRLADANHLPFPAASFDAVSMMDFLEHVENPNQTIAEASRVLRPHGLFFFHTFSRNLLSWLIVIKGMEWFVKNTPPQLHVLNLFIQPTEMKSYLSHHSLELRELFGSRPTFNRAFFRLLRSGLVEPEFQFSRTRSLLLGYTGVAIKR